MLTFPSRFSPVVVLLLAALSGRAQQASSGSAGPQILDVHGGKIRVVPVATGLYHPWSLAFPDARTILVTERNGRLRMIRDGVLQSGPGMDFALGRVKTEMRCTSWCSIRSSRRISWYTSPIPSTMVSDHAGRGARTAERREAHRR